MAAAKTSPEEWRKRVDRWRESGLSAEQFASEVGINAGTLRFWQSKLRALARDGATAAKPVPATKVPFVEVRPAPSGDQAFELELDRGRRLRVPASFDAGALQRLLDVLERK